MQLQENVHRVHHERNDDGDEVAERPGAKQAAGDHDHQGAEEGEERGEGAVEEESRAATRNRKMGNFGLGPPAANLGRD